MNARFEQPFETGQTRTTHREPLFGDQITTVEEYTLSDVNLPSGSVQPLEDFQVGVTFEATEPFTGTPASRFAVDLDHPDDCSVSSLLGADTVGAELVIEVESSVTETVGPGCYDLTQSVGIDSWAANVPAVAQGVEGTQEITVRLLGANTGQVVDEETREVVVDLDADPIDDPPEDGDETPLDRLLDLLPGDGLGDGVVPGGATGGLAALVLVLLLLLVVSVAS